MGEHSNDYWLGNKHAVLRRSEIHASWLKSRNFDTRLDVMNRAFCIFYWARKSIDNTNNVQHSEQMRRALEACASHREGAFKFYDPDGANTLIEGFNHLSLRGGKWHDGNKGQYAGGRGKSYNATLVDSAQACTNFLTAIDKDLPKLAGAMDVYQRECREIAAAGNPSSGDSSDWAKLNERVKRVGSAANKVKHLSWLMPGIVEVAVPDNTSFSWKTRETLANRTDKAVSLSKKTISFVDTLSHVTGALDVFAKVQGLEDQRSLNVLNYAMNYMPVIGAFYQPVIEKIPGLINDWTDFSRSYHLRFSHTPGWLQARRNAPKAWKCPICHSSGGF